MAEYIARRARLGFAATTEARVRRELIANPNPLAVAVSAIDRPLQNYAPFNFMITPGWKGIVKFVSLKEGVPVEEIVGPTRRPKVVHARMVAMAMIREHCGHSLPQIGRNFNRDHTTVLNAIRTVKKGFPAKRWSNKRVH